MGTDFSYDDMATRDVDDDERQLLREDTVGDQAVGDREHSQEARRRTTSTRRR
ncbi:MAG: hypothetical protein IPK07_35610 [Deltaproteobacteria bacterium]|nr:hypothetical protein [Deltaproteobacteria bacterium]